MQIYRESEGFWLRDSVILRYILRGMRLLGSWKINWC